MIDSTGGPVKVNNLQTINSRSLKCMERRAGNVIESVTKQSALKAAKEACAEEFKV